MIAEGGGFAASLDADSEGEEGKFYVWTQAEIVRACWARRTAAISPRSTTSPTTATGRATPSSTGCALRRCARPPTRSALAELRAKLLARARQARAPRLGRQGAGRLERPDDRRAGARRASCSNGPSGWQLAKRAFDFVVTRMSENGRLLHAYRAGQAKAPATASDYANMIWAALRLNEATNEQRYFDQAVAWVEVLDKHYWVDGRRRICNLCRRYA